MGPAYGHAAIRLRFDPSRAYQEDGERPTEASRAHVVLETLARMDAHGNEAVWRAQVDELREQWSGAVEAAAPNGRWRDTCESLDELVSDAVEHFGYALNIRAEYSSRAWRRAEVLYDRWRRQAEDSAAEDALTTEPEDAFVTARDVLNAAWLMRIDRPDDMGRTEATATAMCRRVLMTREAGGTQGQEPIPTT
jgi:hypothetical protein